MSSVSPANLEKTAREAAVMKDEEESTSHYDESYDLPQKSILRKIDLFLLPLVRLDAKIIDSRSSQVGR
jgi:hypothetical protein